MRMKAFRLCFAGVLAAVCSLAVPMNSAADPVFVNEVQVSEAVGTGVDFIGGASGSVENIAESFKNALLDNSNEKQLDGLVQGLEKVSFESGWAKQVGKLKKIAGVAGFLSKAIGSLGDGQLAGELVAAVQAQDRVAFQNIIADKLTSMAADFIAGQISKLVYKHATGVAATGLISGGFTLLWAGVEFAAGVFVDAYGGELIKKAIESTFINDLLLDLGGSIYDSMFSREQSGEEKKSQGEGNEVIDDGNGMMCRPGEGPFDSNPEGDRKESGNRENRYQGLAPIKLF